MATRGVPMDFQFVVLLDKKFDNFKENKNNYE